MNRTTGLVAEEFPNTINNQKQVPKVQINQAYVKLCNYMVNLGLSYPEVRRVMMGLLQITRKDIADHLDVTPTSVSNALRDHSSLELKIEVARFMQVRVWDVFDVDIPR